MDLIAPVVCFDAARHSCIVVRVTERKIFVVPMTADGIDLVAWPVSKFKETRSPRTGEIVSPEWAPDDYSVGRAAAHYLASGEIIPISKGARQQLEQLTSPLDIAPAAVKAAAIAFVNTARRRAGRSPLAEDHAPSTEADKEIDMATAKKPAAKAAPKKAAKPAAKPVAKKEVGGVAEPKARKPGVTQLIKDLVLKGKDTEEIRMEIADKFPASKAGAKEISWCRSQLRKEGHEV